MRRQRREHDVGRRDPGERLVMRACADEPRIDAGPPRPRRQFFTHRTIADHDEPPPTFPHVIDRAFDALACDQPAGDDVQRSIATFEATTNQGFIVIPPDRRWSPGFIYEWFRWHADDLAAIATGATFREITKGAFKRVPFVVPAQSILDAHRDLTSPLESKIHVLEDQTRTLAGLRDLLLPNLVTGRIDVSHLDFDALTEAAIA